MTEPNDALASFAWARWQRGRNALVPLGRPRGLGDCDQSLGLSASRRAWSAQQRGTGVGYPKPVWSAMAASNRRAAAMSAQGDVKHVCRRLCTVAVWRPVMAAFALAAFSAAGDGRANAQAAAPVLCPSLSGEARAACFRAEIERQSRLAVSAEAPPRRAQLCPSVPASMQPACFAAELERQRRITNPPAASAAIAGPIGCPSLPAGERAACDRAELARQASVSRDLAPSASVEAPLACPSLTGLAARAACHRVERARQAAAMRTRPSEASHPARLDCRSFQGPHAAIECFEQMRSSER